MAPFGSLIYMAYFTQLEFLRCFDVIIICSYLILKAVLKYRTALTILIPFFVSNCDIYFFDAIFKRHNKVIGELRRKGYILGRGKQRAFDSIYSSKIW